MVFLICYETQYNHNDQLSAYEQRDNGIIFDLAEDWSANPFQKLVACGNQVRHWPLLWEPMCRALDCYCIDLSSGLMWL